MDDRSGDAGMLLGMAMFVILSQTEEDGELWVLVKTTRDVVDCPSCGVRATGPQPQHRPGAEPAG